MIQGPGFYVVKEWESNYQLSPDPQLPSTLITWGGSILGPRVHMWNCPEAHLAPAGQASTSLAAVGRSWAV